MEEFDFNSLNFDSFDSPQENEDGENQFKLAGGVSVSIVDSDQAVCDYLDNIFGGNVPTAYSLSALEPQLNLDSRVVIMGPSCASEPEFAIVKSWSKKYPQVATVLVTPDLSTDLLQLAMRSGVKDVISAPIDEENLISSVNRIADSLPTADQLVSAATTPVNTANNSSSGGKIISVFSTKGGSGKSVSATNLGVVLANRAQGPVVVVDANFQCGDIGVMLKVNQSSHTVMDALLRANEIDEALLMSFMSKHEASDLYILPGPSDPVFSDQVDPEAFLKIIACMKDFAEFIVVDLPSHLDDLVFKVLENSDEIVLIAGLDIPNIKNVRIAMKVLSMLNVNQSNIHLLLNRANSKVKLEANEVEKALGFKVEAHVPSDVVVPISVNKGTPVVLSAPKSGVARAFEEFGMRFFDGVALAPANTGNRRKFFG